jgi:predicted DsbA family dithiol-disulfide isomerase
MIEVEVYADVCCPFTHFGLRRLVEARRAHGSNRPIRIRAWPLEWVNGTALEPEAVASEIAALRAQVAPDLFRRFDARAFPHTSIPAFGLAAAAYGCDLATGERVSLALRDALFEHGLDVSDAGVLDRMAAHFGIVQLDPESIEASVRADWRRGTTRGVQGSPHFFVGSRSWFCPTLVIAHEGGEYEVQTSDVRLRDFYAAALS